MLYQGGQTIYSIKEDKAFLFIDVIIQDDEKKFSKSMKVYDGNKFKVVNGAGISMLFIDKPQKCDRTLYHGDFCNNKVYEGIDVDEIVKEKKAVSSHLRKVKRDIAKGKIFAKNFNKK